MHALRDRPDQRTRADLALAGAGIGAFLVGAAAARRPEVGALEHRWFARVNTLPARWHPPVWVVMQLGSLGGVVAVTTAAAAAGRPDIARRAGVAGSLAWIAAKGVKRFVGRERPGAVVPGTRILGREQSGLGYPSGHAAVTTAMVTAIAPVVSPRRRALLWLVPVSVGSARMYTGAHLPLDIAGGVALGVACAGVCRDLPAVTGRA